MKQNKIFKDQYIVVTGAAGFIGSSVIRYLNEQKYSNLILVDDFKESIKWKNLNGKKFCDILSRYTLFEWLEGREDVIEAFIHLGACSSTLEKNADYLLENNYRFSIKLAEYAFKNEHRFIYASSAATYGDGSKGFLDDHEMLDELLPLNMYGYSKHLFDLWLKRENLLNKVIGLKYFNVFGPNEYHKGKMASKVLHMYYEILEKGYVSLFKSNDPKKYKDGQQQRDFIYVKDAVKMTCDLLQDSFKDVGGIFNIGSGQAVSWNEIAHAVFDALGKKPDIRYIDIPKELAKQYQNYTCANMEKFNELHEIKDLKPITTPISVAIKDYVQNYLTCDARW